MNNLTKFKKGHIPWNKDKKLNYPSWSKGKKRSDMIGNKFAKGCFQPNKGKKLSKGHRDSISIATRKAMTLEIRKTIGLAAKGRKHTLEQRIKRKEFSKGISNPNWKGGLSFNPYHEDFNRELKLKIRHRDNFKCQLCGISEKECIIKYGRVLSVNHIDYNKQNCSEDNLNALCCSCNFIVNGDREKWTKLFKEKLLEINQTNLW